jgi:hypothetical protein
MGNGTSEGRRGGENTLYSYRGLIRLKVIVKADNSHSPHFFFIALLAMLSPTSKWFLLIEMLGLSGCDRKPEHQSQNDKTKVVTDWTYWMLYQSAIHDGVFDDPSIISYILHSQVNSVSSNFI